jgi:hypothetical protein
MSRRTLSGIALVLLTAVSAKAQFSQETPTPGPTPLEVSLKPTGQQRQQLVRDPHSSTSAPSISVRIPELSVVIRNISDKCVIAVGVSLSYKESNGKPSSTGYVGILRQRNGQFKCLETGQTEKYILSEDRFDESLRPMTPEVSVDFVIFGDGSTWGPGNNLEQKGYLRGRFDAYKHIQMVNQKRSSHPGTPSLQHGPG